MFRLSLGLILVALPLLELALLIKTGQVVGFWATLALVIGAAVLGAFVLSRQSLGALRRATQAIEQGQPPVAHALDGAFLAAAGLLLITPGFLSDFIALLLLIPPLRHALARWVVRHAVRRSGLDMRTASAEREAGSQASTQSAAHEGKGPIIEGEFERLGETPGDSQATKP
jgi:UPF0716 protein FxsA